MLAHERGEKLRVVKFKPKRGYKRRTGHRQELTRIEITEIGLGGAKAARKPAKPAAASHPEAAAAASHHEPSAAESGAAGSGAPTESAAKPARAPKPAKPAAAAKEGSEDGA